MVWDESDIFTFGGTDFHLKKYTFKFYFQTSHIWQMSLQASQAQCSMSCKRIPKGFFGHDSVVNHRDTSAHLNLSALPLSSLCHTGKSSFCLTNCQCPVNQRYARLLGPNARCRSQQIGDGGCGRAVWAALRQIMCVVTPPPTTPSSASHIITIPLGNMRRLGEQGGETGEMVHSLAHVIER